MASEPERLGGDQFVVSWSAGRADLAARHLQRRCLLNDALATLSCLFVGTGIVALLVSFHLPLGWDFVASVTLSLALMFALVIYALPAHPHRRFGYANLVTAFRASLVSLTFATVICFESLAATDIALWTLVGVVLFALALDGVDGYLARRYSQESNFGARFDMEVDALLILVLSLAAALLDKAGLWVLLIGLMRYGFVATGWVWPRLNGELPPSFRRKLVCVLQIAGLCIILVPFVTPPYSTAIAAAALSALVYSFAVDILFLLRRPVET
ncbi:MAG: CDP-alcohol phosphatidyltransferase family protein [Rhizobium rhizophilum]|uniref:CDP-alcohol phosphatidyltransferase family protein n=1 Tax=Rhizobium rhizophilum TaxID=1850373 RepID=UPI00391DC25D